MESTFSPAHLVIFCRSQQTPRVSRTELLKATVADRLAHVRHQPLVESNIMHRNQHGSKHLTSEKEMADRPACKRATGVAIAAFFYRAGIGDQLAVAQSQWTLRREGIRVSPVARGHDAIEHIHTLGNGGDDVARETDAHQVARLVLR